MQPIQLLDVLGMDAAAEDGLVVGVRICRYVDEAAFVEADCRLLERLMPQLMLASQASARLNRVLGEHQLFRQVFAGMAIGTLSLDSRLRLLHRDVMASALLDAGALLKSRVSVCACHRERGRNSYSSR